MKTALTLIFAVLFNVTFVHSQITIVDFDIPIVESDSSKTIFVYRDSDENNLDELTKVIDDNWSYNDIELMSIDAFKSYEMRENDFLFMIEYSVHETSSNTSSMTHYFVDFSLAFSQKRKKEYGYNLLSKSVVSVSGPTIADVCQSGSTPQDHIVYEQYKTKPVFSWNFAYLGTVMKTLSSKLPEGKEYNSIKDDNGDLSGLKEKKLYITDAIQIKASHVNGIEQTTDQEANVDEEYDYTYEIVSNEELNELITSGEKGYVFMTQKIDRGKVSIVIDLSTMQIIYHDREYNHYAFDKKDISRLNNAIAKASK